MSIHLARDMETLKKDLLTMGAMVEEAIFGAVTALRERRPDVARDVIAGDDRIDRWEIEVEEECLKILALHQPVAKDLRFIASVMKINNDLERMGDLAVNIAERAAFLATVPPIPIPRQLSPMAEAAMRMARESLDAFVNCDPKTARRICKEDDEVDGYDREVIQELQELMERHPETIPRATQLFSVSRQLERIADHATNIAEDVVYMVEGEIIRHAGAPHELASRAPGPHAGPEGRATVRSEP